jgi:hypothetical protein|tara:strand:+ start:634 stop:786 length:153 start_codon:yes stop_codon:yes gene_type:complete
MFPSSSCSNIRAASLFFVFAAFQRLLFDSLILVIGKGTQDYFIRYKSGLF